MKTDVKILHAACCATNSPIKSFIEEVAKNYKKEVEITEYSDLMETMQFGTTTFPSLVINGKVYDFKKINDASKLHKLL
jgi:glutaredoxin